MHVCYPGETCEQHFTCSCKELEKSNRQLGRQGYISGEVLSRAISFLKPGPPLVPSPYGPLGGVAHKTPLQSSRSLRLFTMHFIAEP